VDADGYESVQVGFTTQKEKNLKKAQKGHFGNLGDTELTY